MSGNVVAWVFDHYPVNSAQDRTRKIVLSEVAEAANRDFEHAHPGNAKLCAHWHLSRSTVSTALRELIDDGWLEVQEEGGGRGRATVYRVRRERVQGSRGLDEPSAPENRAMAEPKPRDLERETARSRDSIRISAPSTPLENTLGAAAAPPDELEGMPSKPKSQRASSTVVAEADAIARRVFADRQPKPLPKFLNVRGLVVHALDARWSAAEVEAVMMRPDTVFTLPGLEMARAKQIRSNGRASEKQDMIARRYEQRKHEDAE